MKKGEDPQKGKGDKPSQKGKEVSQKGKELLLIAAIVPTSSSPWPGSWSEEKPLEGQYRFDP